MAKFTYFAVDANNSFELGTSNAKTAKYIAKNMGCDLFRQANDSDDKECVWVNPELKID